MNKLLLITFFLSTFNLHSQDDPYLLKEIKAGDKVNAICYFPDGKKILIGLMDGTAEIIDLESGKTDFSFKEHWKGIMDVDVAPGAKFYMTAGDNTIKVWSPEGKEISRMPGHTTTIYSAQIDPSGKYIVSGAINKVFKFWEIKTGKLLYDMKGHTDVVMAVAFSHDGTRIASGSGDNTIRIWETGTDKEIMQLKGHLKDIYDVKFSHDGKYLASCSKDKTIRIYDLEKGELYKTLTGHKDFVLDIEFAPGDLHLISCSFDKEIKLWEIPTGKSLYSFIDHDEEVIDLCFAPDGKSFASASHDKTLKIYNYSPEIFVDYYFSNEIVKELEKNDLFLPRQKGESRKDYSVREEEAKKVKDQIYERYYTRYLEELKNNSSVQD